MGKYSKNKFKISSPTWNDEFELPDGSYSISDIKDYYFEHTLKKYGEKIMNTSIRIYEDKIGNRITFKIKDIIQNTIQDIISNLK